MLPDLFGYAGPTSSAASEKSGEKSGEVRNNASGLLFRLNQNPGSPEAPRTPEESPEFSGGVPHLAVSTDAPNLRGFGLRLKCDANEKPGRPNKETHLSALLSKRRKLETDLCEVNAELATATAAQDPFEAAFQVAHQTLLNADRARLTKPQLFALYDARMNAGHAWNPHRKRMKEAMQWRGAVLRDLQAINMELE